MVVLGEKKKFPKPVENTNPQIEKPNKCPAGCIEGKCVQDLSQ